MNNFEVLKEFEGSKILITGATGLIGRTLIKKIFDWNRRTDRPIKAAALVRNEQKAAAVLADEIADGLEIMVGDVRTAEPRDIGADYIIHAASQASNIQFENDPVGTITANLTGTANVLDFAKKSGAKSTLIVSSLKVYGIIYGSQDKITEDDSGYIDFTSYKNCYAMGKRASETLAASYCREYGMNVKLARPAYIYGAATLDDDRVWAQFIANVVRGQDILLKSNGAANRSFCYVTDTATGLLTVLLKGENALPYNISCELSDTTIRGFARAACAAFPERNISLKFANPADEQEPQNQPSPLCQVPEILDNKRLKSLGWQPKVSLKEGIKRAVAVLEEQT